MNDLFFFCVFFVIKANENVGPIRLADVICNHSQNQRVERFKDPLDGVTTQRSLGGHRAPIKMERCHCSLGCWFNFSSSHSHSTRVLWLSLDSFFSACVSFALGGVIAIAVSNAKWCLFLFLPFLINFGVCALSQGGKLNLLCSFSLSFFSHASFAKQLLQRMEPTTQYNMVFGGKHICQHNLRWILTDYHTNANFKVSRINMLFYALATMLYARSVRRT